MKPRLVLGLGNDLAGDDGIGLRIAERLADHPDLPDDVEVRVGGADLLRAQDALRGREQIFLVDAVLGSEEPGTVVCLDASDARLANQRGSAHQLSPTAALALLRAVDPALREVPVHVLGVVIESARVGDSLSPDFDRQLEDITERTLASLRDVAAAPR